MGRGPPGPVFPSPTVGHHFTHVSCALAWCEVAAILACARALTGSPVGLALQPRPLRGPHQPPHRSPMQLPHPAPLSACVSTSWLPQSSSTAPPSVFLASVAGIVSLLELDVQDPDDDDVDAVAEVQCCVVLCVCCAVRLWRLVAWYWLCEEGPPGLALWLRRAPATCPPLCPLCNTKGCMHSTNPPACVTLVGPAGRAAAAPGGQHPRSAGAVLHPGGGKGGGHRVAQCTCSGPCPQSPADVSSLRPAPAHPPPPPPSAPSIARRVGTCT